MIYQSDCLTVLKILPDESVNCCITSPPYYGLRDYGVDGQIGLEQSPDEYVAKLVEVFREIKRVLRDDGTVWLNLGDSYATAHASGTTDEKTGWKHGPLETNHRGRANGGDLKPKDLIGIPWRVAFALQQPYYSGIIKDERDRLWMAGLIDGEGCLTILNSTSNHGSGDSYPPIMQVRMCDIEPLQKLIDITGHGKRSPKQEPPSQITQRPSYQWRIHARKAADIAAELYPYLLVKKKQAIVLWNMQLVRENYIAKRGSIMPKEILEKQIYLYELSHQLNKDKDSVDLPSWLVEPKTFYEKGWYLRSDCIWAKPNPMPESVKDRPTKAHEYIFLLAKNAKYYYDYEAILEPANYDGRKDTIYKGGDKDVSCFKHERWSNKIRDYKTKEGGNGQNPQHHGKDVVSEIPGRNKRSVWTVATKPFKGAHFAIFPEKLIEPCVLAGCPADGVILDPFCGSGTTGVVCAKHGREFIGIELNPDYVEMAEWRINKVKQQMRLDI